MLGTYSPILETITLPLESTNLRLVECLSEPVLFSMLTMTVVPSPSWCLNCSLVIIGTSSSGSCNTLKKLHWSFTNIESFFSIFDSFEILLIRRKSTKKSVIRVVEVLMIFDMHASLFAKIWEKKSFIEKTVRDYFSGFSSLFFSSPYKNRAECRF